MNPTLDAALAECDGLGVTLWVEHGKLSFRAGEFGFPDRLRDTLRGHRDVLGAWLGDHSRPCPEWVPFVARNLDVIWFEFPLVKTVAVLLVSKRPYYRLTPAVWVAFCHAIDRKAASIQDDPAALAQVRAGADLLDSLSGWVRDHYRPDQLRRAWANPRPLPLVPRGPVVIDHQEPSQPEPVRPDAAQVANLPHAAQAGPTRLPAVRPAPRLRSQLAKASRHRPERGATLPGL